MVEHIDTYIQDNPDGSFTVPRSMRRLIHISAAGNYTHFNPTFPIFGENDGNADFITVEFRGDQEVGRAVLESAILYSQAFLHACDAHPTDIAQISTLYHEAEHKLRSFR